MRKKALFILSILLVFMTSIAFSALSTSLMITADINFRVLADIRVTGVSFNNATGTAEISYESDYSKNTASNGFILPTSGDSISYNVVIENSGDVDYAIYDIIRTSSDNGLQVQLSGYNVGDVIPSHSSVTLVLTYTTTNPSNDVIGVTNKFDFRRVYYVTYETGTQEIIPAQIKYHDINLTLTSTQPTMSGYTFTKWNTKSDGTGVNYNSGATYTTNDDATMYAKFSLNAYNITYVLNGGINNQNNPSTYTIEDSDITLADATKDGYVFKGWTGNGTTTPTKNLVLPTGSTGDKEFTAIFKDETAPTVEITNQDKTINYLETANNVNAGYDTNNANIKVYIDAQDVGSGVDKIEYVYSNSTTVPTTGWDEIQNGALTVNKTHGTYYLHVRVTDKENNVTTVTTKYMRVRLRITYYDDYSSSTATSQNQYSTSVGASITTRTPTAREGYTFDGWYDSAALTTKVVDAGVSYTPTTSIRLYGKWTPVDYTLTYALNNGTVTPANPTSYNIESSAITLNNPTKTLTFVGHYNATSGANAASGSGVAIGSNTTANQTFAGWSGTGLTGNVLNVTIPTGSTGDRSYTAHYTAVAPTSLPTITRTGYTCGWNTSSTGTTIQYDNSGTKNYPASAITESQAVTVNLYAVCIPNEYNITYTMNGGFKGTSAPNTAEYDQNLVVSKPTKTFTVNINANGKNAAIKNAQGTDVTSASSPQIFLGWTGNNINTSTAKYGATTNPTLAWDGTTKVGSSSNTMYFLNLRTDTGTVELVANWQAVNVTLPTVSKTGYSCKFNTAADGTGTDYNSGANYTPSTTTNSETLYVVCTANTYNISYTLNGGNDPTTKPQQGTYDSDVVISNPSKTVTIIGNVNGTGATVGANTSSTQTFAGWTSSTIGSNAQTGTTATNHTAWNGTTKTKNTHFKNLIETGTVTMVANWTPVAINLPTLEKIGYTCKWYTEATGGSELGAGGASYTPAANSDQSITVYARCSERTDTPYRVNHYVHDLGTNTYTLDSYDDLTGRTNSSVTLASLKKTITGATYVDGYITGNTTKPTSGAVTTTTILADGSRVINLYYRRNYLYVQYHVNGGSLSSSHGTGYGISGSLITSTANTTTTNFLMGVYGGKVNTQFDTNTYTASTNGLHNWNSSTSINIERAGYKAVSGSEWNTKADGTGTSYSQNNGTYDVNGFAGADLSNGDAVVTLYVNWASVNYTLTYTLNNGTVTPANPTSYNVESSPITLNNPTKTLTFKGNYNATSGANASSASGVTIGSDTTKNQTFAGWSGTGLTGNVQTVTIPTGSTGNRSYTAHYTAVAGTVPTVTRPGYTCGWSTSSSGTTIEIASGGSFATSRITDDMAVTVNLYAVCNPKTYTVTANANGGEISSTTGWTGTGNTATKSVTFGSTYGTLPTVAKTGYTFNGWSLLPEGYTPVEYIKFSGTQYIDTGILTSQSLKIESEFSTTSANKIVFGARRTASYDALIFGYFATNNAYVGFGGSTSQYATTMNLIDGNKHAVLLSKDTYSIDGVNQTINNRGTLANFYNIYLGTWNNAGTADNRMYVGNIYSFKIYDNDSLVADMIPCINDATGKAGMYDLVRGTFYGNAGTGDIVAGNADYLTSSTTVVTPSNHNIYAHWTPITYSISYTLNGGNNPNPKPTAARYDENVNIGNPTKVFTVNVNENSQNVVIKDTNGTEVTSASSPQVFSGWSSSTISSTAQTGANTSSYATWNGTTKTKNTYFKNLSNISNGSVTMVANWTAVNVTLPILEKTGYTCGYATSASGAVAYASGASYTPSTTANSATLFVKCSPNTYTVTAKANGGSISSTTGWTGTGNTATKQVTYDSAYGTLPTVSRAGYTFLGWNGKNLVKPLSQETTRNGIKITPQADGSVILSGTKTGDINTTIVITDYFVVVPNTQYIVSIGDYNNSLINNYGLKGFGGNKSINHTVNFTSEGIQLFIPEGTVLSNVKLYPQIELGTIATPYEPYYISNTTTVTTAENHEINAKWEIIPYTITYALNNGTVSPANPTTYNVESSAITLNNPTKTLTFKGNYNATSGANAASGSGVTIGSNTTVDQTFTGWSGTGLTGSTNKTVTIAAGSTGNRSYTAHWTAVAPAKLPKVTRTGYTCGWSTSSSGTTIQYASEATNYPTSAITEGMAVTVNLYAVCTPKTYTLTINPNGGTYNSTTSNSTKTMTYDSSNNNNIGVPTRSGYTFDGWYIEANSKTNKLFDNTGKNTNLSGYFSAAYSTGVWKKESNVTVYAHWSKAVTATTNSISPTSYIYDGTAKSPTPTVKDGSTTLVSGTDYTISYTNNTNVGTATATITGKSAYNATTKAYYTGTTTINFAINNAKLTFNKGTCDSTSGTTTLYTKKGATGVYTGIQNTTPGTIPTASKTGYTFQGWYNASSNGTKVLNANGSFTGTGVTNYTNATSWQTVADQTLYAVCTPNTYTVTANANGGSISSTTGWAGSGATATKSIAYDSTYGTLPTVLRTGYTLGGWAYGVQVPGRTEKAWVTQLTDTSFITANLTPSTAYKVEYDITLNEAIPSGYSASQTNQWGNLGIRTGSSTYTLVSGGTLYDKSGSNYTVGQKYHVSGTITTPSDLSTAVMVFYTARSQNSSNTGYVINGTFSNIVFYPSANTYGPVTATTVNKIASNHTIKAGWTPNTYTIKYNGNGNTGGSTANSTHTYDVEKALTTNGFTRTGYTFTGWSTSASDKNLAYDNAEYVKDNTSGSSYVDIKSYTVAAPFAAGEVYQLDFEAKGTGNLTTYFYGGSNYLRVASVTNSEGYSGTSSDGNNAVALTSSYKHYSVRFTLGSTGDGSVNKIALFRVFSGNSATIKNIRFFKVSSSSTAYVDGQSVKNLTTTDGATINLYAIWKDLTPPVVATATPSTVFDLRNYVDFNATDAGSGVAYYNITTSTTAPTTWIPVVSTVEATTETKYAESAAWARVLHHNNHWGTSGKYFANATEAQSITNDNDKYSVMGNIANYKNSSNWEFMLQYPGVSSTQYNRWTQTSNPITNTNSVTGYTAIHADWTSAWFGLALSSSSSTYMDGQSGSSWWYAVGAYSRYADGMPGPYVGSTPTPAATVNLWARIDNLTNTTSTNLTRRIGDIAANGTYYVWAKDGEGNTAYKQVTISKVDTTAPTAAITSTNNVATSQTVTLTLGDNSALHKYAFGTTNPANTNQSYTAISNNPTSSTQTATVSAGGTYYVTVVDSAGNKYYTNKVFYKTTLNANGGSVSPASVVTMNGNSFALPAPTRSGYTFGGWYTDSECTTAVTLTSGNYKPTANTELYAKWTPVNYTITYALNNGTVSSANPATYNIESSAITLNNPTKTLTFKGNYNATSGANAVSGSGVSIGSNTTASQTFAGWSGTGLSSNTVNVTIPTGSTGNRSYTAHWTAVAPTKLPKVTRTGHTCGWSTSSSGTTIQYASEATNYPTSAITEGQAVTVNLYAVCVPNVYTITLNQQSGSGGTSTIYLKYNTGYYLNNSNGTVSNQMTTSANAITVPTRSGYTFNGYYTAANGGTQYIDANGKLTSSASITQFTAAGTLYAKWTKAVSSLTNSISPTSYIYDGTAKSPTPTVKDGSTTLVSGTDYTISYTNNTNVGTATATITGKSAYNATTKAYYTGTKAINFAINNAKLTFNKGTCDATSGTTTLYTKKGATGVYTGIQNTTPGTIPTASKTGYTFEGWYNANSNGSKVLNANGSFTGTGVTNYTNATSWQTVADQTLYARCTIASYTITFVPAGGTMNSSTSTTSYTQNYGTTITMNNPTRSGYEFMGWLSNQRTNVTTAGYWTYSNSKDPLTGGTLEIINAENHRLNGYASGKAFNATPTTITGSYSPSSSATGSVTTVNYTSSDPNPLSGISATSFYRNTRTSYTNAAYSPGPLLNLPYLHRDVNQVYVIVARFPTGWSIAETSNSGGGNWKWLTSTAGTGTWQTYVLARTSLENGQYMNSGHFYITNSSSSNTTNPTLDVAYIQGYYTNVQSSTASANKFKIGSTNETLTARWQAFDQTVKITPNNNKATFKVKATNLFDKTDMIVSDAKIVSKTPAWGGASTVSADSTHFISGWIPVVAGATYKITGATEAGLVEWSENAKNTRIYYNSTQATSYSNNTNFTVPTTYVLYSNGSTQNVTYKYMRFHAKTADIDSLKLEMVDSASYTTTQTLLFPNNATVIVTSTPTTGYSTAITKSSGLGTLTTSTSSGVVTGTLAGVSGAATTTNLAITNSGFPYTVQYCQGNNSTTAGSTCNSTLQNHTYGTATALTQYSTLGFTVPSGWTFAGWSTSQAGTAVSTVNGVVLTDKASTSNYTNTNGATVKLYAIFRRDITFKSGASGGTTKALEQRYNPYRTTGYITSVTSPTALTAISNWTALGYRADTTPSTATLAVNTAVTPAYNATATTYYGVYSRNINVYTNVKTSQTSSTKTQYLNSNENKVSSITVDAPTAVTNWTALGYRADATADNKQYDSGSITPAYSTSAVSLYSVYSRQFTITYAGNGNTGGSTASNSVTVYMNTNSTTTSAQTIKLAANGFTKTGHVFDKWTIDSSDYAQNTNYTPATAVAYNATTFGKTATAKWTLAKYKIQFCQGNNTTTAGSTCSSTLQEHTYGTATALTQYSSLGFTAPSGWTFAGWSTSQAGTAVSTVNGVVLTDKASTSNYTNTNGATVKLYAIFRRDITFKSGASGGTTKALEQRYNPYKTTGYITSVTSPAASTVTAISNWTATGWRNDATAGNYTLAFATSVTPAYNATATIYYATYSRELSLYSGVNNATNPTTNPTTNKKTQYLNVNGNKVTAISAPAPTAITNWSPLGYRANTTAAAASYAVTTAAANISPAYTTANSLYAVYSRTLTINYNGNGHTGGSTDPTTKVIYLNSNSTTTSSQKVQLAANGFTKTSATFSKWAVDSANGTQYAAQANYTAGFAYNDSSFSKTMYAIWTLTTPSVTLTATNTSRIYGVSTTTTLTCSNGTTYQSGATVYYSFGSATTSGGTVTWSDWGTSSTTTVASNAYVGTKYWKCKVYVVAGNTSSSAGTSAEKAVTINNVTLTLNANNCGTISGTSPIYVHKNEAGIFTGIGNETAVTSKPKTTKSGYTFSGWYTAAGGTNMVLNASVNPVPNVTNWTDSNGKWLLTANNTIYAHCSRDNYTITYALNNGTNNANNPSSYNVESAAITLGDATKTITFKGNVNSAAGSNATSGSGVSIGSNTTANQTFAGWTGNGTTTPTKNLVLRSGSTGNKTYTANWTPVAPTKLPKITRTGYDCGWNATNGSTTKTWNSEGTNYPANTTYIPNNSSTTINLYGVCIPKTYNLVIKPNGGTFMSSTADAGAVLKYDAKDGNNIGAASRTGCSFLGWYTGAANGTQLYDSAGKNVAASGYWSAAYSSGVWKRDGGATVYAHWGVTLTINPNGGTYNGSTSNATKQMLLGASTNNNIGAASKTGYTFDGWYNQASGGTKLFDASGKNVAASGYWSAAYSSGVWQKAAATTVYAHYTINKYTLSVSSTCNSQSSHSCGTFTVKVAGTNVATNVKSYSGSHNYNSSYTITPTAANGATAPAAITGTLTAAASKTVAFTFSSKTFGSASGLSGFTIPLKGTYKIELYAPKGGTIGNRAGGQGGKVIGNRVFNLNDAVYVGVGLSPTNYNGGYNGGGAGNGNSTDQNVPNINLTCGSSCDFARGGGGATHIGTQNKAINNSYNSANLIAVAGGGGGCGEINGGGAGGGTQGHKGYGDYGGSGGSQSGGGQDNGDGCTESKGRFGQGGRACTLKVWDYERYWAGGGGGGYYGGGGGDWSSSYSSSSYSGGGGGGSSYVGGLISGTITNTQGGNPDSYGWAKLTLVS